MTIDGDVADAATVELSRAQLWTWVRHRVRLADGRVVDRELVTSVVDEELSELCAERRAAGHRIPRRRGDDPRSAVWARSGDRLAIARDVLLEVALGADFPSFFTTRVYADHLLSRRTPCPPHRPLDRPRPRVAAATIR